MITNRERRDRKKEGQKSMTRSYTWVGPANPVVDTALQFFTIVAGEGPGWSGLHPGSAGKSIVNELRQSQNHPEPRAKQAAYILPLSSHLP